MSNISKINLYCQKLKLIPPYFEILEKEGKDHNPTFHVNCKFGKHNSIGIGSTLKIAKEDAAAKIVQMIGIESKLKENNTTYTVESPLTDIWNSCDGQCYKLTLRKKHKSKLEHKHFMVKFLHLLD